VATQRELNLHDSVRKARLVNYFKIGLDQCLVCVGQIPVTVRQVVLNSKVSSIPVQPLCTVI
jgi:hypothetical protein